jgi:hypothetical protein
MRKLFFLFLAVFLFGSVDAQKRYVVKLKDKPLSESRVETGDRDSNNDRQNGPRKDKLDKVDRLARSKGVNNILKSFADAEVGFIAELTDAQRQALQADSEVESVLEDFKMQSKPRMQSRPRMQSKPRMQVDYGYDIDLGTSCAINESGGPIKINGSEKKSIWVIDSGIDGKHKDLKVDKKYSKSFIDSKPLEDGAGHGTHVAGIAAADGKGNPSSFRMSGVAAGANLISLKVLDSNGEGYWSDIIAALDHVSKFGIKGDVVMMSLGSFEIANCENSNPQLKQAIEHVADLGIFVVMSAGNDEGDAMRNSPGCISGPNIFTIGSIDSSCADGTIGCSEFSNFGPNVDWVVPGDNIFSTFPGDEYAIQSGTSMSCALFAGIMLATDGNPKVSSSISCGGRSYSIPRVR